MVRDLCREVDGMWSGLNVVGRVAYVFNPGGCVVCGV